MLGAFARRQIYLSVRHVRYFSSPSVVVVGASVMDLITYVPRLPQLGETLHGYSFESGFGGKGANQAVSAARLGSSVGLVSSVGDDVYGKMTIDNFHDQNVNVDNVALIQGSMTGVAPISVDKNGNNSVVVILGANSSITKESVNTAEKMISKANILLVQLEIENEVTNKALQLAKQYVCFIFFLFSKKKKSNLFFHTKFCT
eukprot:GSMAST32.ASY1.ANO1.2809.1 assembled CDS